MGNRQDMTAERQSLKDKLMTIILLETSKDYKEMDSDLVTECVDFLMELEGKEKLTKAEIEQRVNAIPFKGKVTAIGSYTKKRLRAKRLAVIAAILAVLLAIFSIVAVSFTDIEDRIIERFSNYIGEIMKSGDHKDFDNIELIKHNESIYFSSAEEFAEYENIGILFPTWLPENNRITKIGYYSEDTLGEYYVLYCGNAAYSMDINIDKTVSDEIKASRPMKAAGEYSVYIINNDDFIQGMFEYNSCCYTVKAYTEEDVLTIIESFKEIE